MKISKIAVVLLIMVAQNAPVMAQQPTDRREAQVRDSAPESDVYALERYARDKNLCVHENRFYSIGSPININGRQYECKHRKSADLYNEAGNYWSLAD